MSKFSANPKVIGYPCVPKMSAEQLKRLEREMAARFATVYDEPGRRMFISGVQ